MCTIRKKSRYSKTCTERIWFCSCSGSLACALGCALLVTRASPLCSSNKFALKINYNIELKIIQCLPRLRHGSASSRSVVPVSYRKPTTNTRIRFFVSSVKHSKLHATFRFDCRIVSVMAPFYGIPIPYTYIDSYTVFTKAG